jgi:hypothetical protein
MAIIVRMTLHTPMPTLIPLTGAAALGLAALAKIASPSKPNTDQIATNANIPAQIAPHGVLGRAKPSPSFLKATSVIGDLPDY